MHIIIDRVVRSSWGGVGVNAGELKKLNSLNAGVLESELGVSSRQFF